MRCPVYFGLMLFHLVFLGCPVAYWNQFGWHPVILCLIVPVVSLWLVLVPADIKFRMQGADRDQRSGFDLDVLEWFSLVFWPVMLGSAVIAGLAGLMWWIGSLFM